MGKFFKKDLIFSSLIILLPCTFGLLLWNRLPNYMVTHWGADGQADGFSEKAVAVFFLPLFLLAAQWLCLFFTGKDPKNKNRNYKVTRLVIWIMPVLSLIVNAIMYCTALGFEPNMTMVMSVLMGIMFILIGNYLPKCQQNYTIGIKIPWTLANEENWNLTHRFGGKCWLLGGLLMLLCGFLPDSLGLWIAISGIFVLIVLPVGYSYRIYRRHRKQGIVYPKVDPMGSKKMRIVSTVLLIVVLCFTAALMFTGDLNYTLSDTDFTVEASYYADLTVSYDSIDSIEFREGNIPGTRTFGFGSARLLMGTFQNEEFGSHTRYTYVNPDGCIVIRSGSKVLVLSAKHYSETLKLYLQLMERVPLP